MDGIQFVSTVRERPKISWMPFILLTAKSAEEARVEGLVGYRPVYLPPPEPDRTLFVKTSGADE